VKDKYETTINWQVDLPGSGFFDLWSRGNFHLLNDHSILLAHTEMNESGHVTKGKLAKITEGRISVIFEIDHNLWSHVSVSDIGDYYLVSTGAIHASGSKRKGMLFKFSKSNVLEWQYELAGRITTLPVIIDDAVFITDFHQIKDTIEGHGNLYKLNNRGELIFKKRLKAFTSYEPVVIRDSQEMILCFRKLNLVEVRDFEGNLKRRKTFNLSGDIEFSRNALGELFALFHGAIVALNKNLDVLWEYKPEIGFVVAAPVFDSKGNSYALLHRNRRFISLDSNGKERWAVPITVNSNQPVVLSDDNILVITSSQLKAESGEEMSISHLEIFSGNGEKLLSYDIPGGCVYAVEDKGTIFVVMGGAFNFTKKEEYVPTLRVLSLKL
jgi:outer membrane protein assembly factor BamB